MPPRPAEQLHAAATLTQLHARDGLTHLRVRKHGAAIIIESGPAADPVKHARVVRDGVSLWILDIADHRGRWGWTGVRTTREAAITELIDSFGWVLGDFARENPARTSDPEY